VLLYGLVFAQWLTAAWFIYIFMLLGAAGGGYLAYKFEGQIIVQLTTVVGSYAIVRGISVVAGGFISEFALMEQIKTGTFHLTGWFYLYMLAFVGLAIGGTYW